MNQGYLWYILPAGSSFSGYDIYSLYNNSTGDHMTSRFCTPPEASGYTCEYQIGRLFSINDPNVGLFPVNRFRKNSGQLDHLDAGFVENPSGYTDEGPNGYAWIATRQPPQTEQANINYTEGLGGDVKIGTSWAWGGSIVSLQKRFGSTWYDFVNRWDAGREIQTTLHMYTTDYTQWDNPTEAGDYWSNGSPILNYDIGFNGQSNRLRTRVNALRWGENDVLNPPPSEEQPVVSGTEIGKDVIILSDKRIQYDSWIVYGKDFTAPAGVRRITENEVAAYLVNDFDRLRILQWNPGSSNFDVIVDEPAHSSVDTNHGHWPTNQSYAIAYKSDGSRAFAIFKKSDFANVALHCITYSSWQSENTPLSFPSVVLSVERWRDSITRGDRVDYRNYILVGTRAEVEAEALALAQEQ